MTTKTKIHAVYKDSKGERVPSVTTVLGILAKPALLDWAWRCGCEGLDYKAVRDKAGDIGTLAHYLIMCHLKNIEPDTSEYSHENIDKAENCLLSFYEWEKQNPFDPLEVELPLVSERYGYGGTIDCLAKSKATGLPMLIDFKTGKAIYPEMFCQLAAYDHLLFEHGYIEPPEIGPAVILRIGRDEDEGFEERALTHLGRQWEVFFHCLRIYTLQAEIRREK